MTTYDIRLAKGRTVWTGALMRCAMVVTTLLGGCGRIVAEASPGSPVGAEDLRFLTTFYNVVEFDRQIVAEELGRNADPRVAALARDLLRQAQAYDAKIRPIAQRDGVTLPDTELFYRQTDMHDRIASLMSTSGYDFDQGFLDDEISMHYQAIARGVVMVGSPASDAELRANAVSALATLRTNLARLVALKNTIVAER